MDTIPYQILLQVVLILLNAFFAGSEIALLSLNTSKLKKLEEEDNDKYASRLLKLVEEPNNFLSTIQIAITLSGFLGAAFAGTNFSVYIVDWIYYGLGFTALSVGTLDSIATVVVTIILSYFTLVFGELVPKRIAMQKSYEFAKMTSFVIATISKIMRPVVVFLNFSVNVILRLLHLNTQAEEENVSEEEIRLMIDLGGKKGTIENEEKEWLENVFEFNDTSAKDVMTHVLDVVFISVHDSKEEVLETIRETGLSRFPLIDEDVNDVRGILYSRDFLLNEALGENKSLEDMMKEAYFVPESIHTDDLFNQLQNKKVHIAIVVDEYGETSGIVTLEDLLEEIVGNIYDEYDPMEEEEIKQIDDHTYRIAGNVLIEDILDQTGIEIPEDEDYDTLGGFIFAQLQEIPSDGSILDLDFEKYSIHVDQIIDKHVESCVIILKEQKEKEESEE